MEVIMFHSIGCVDSSWSRNYLTVDWKHFEKFCEYLKKSKIETLSLEEWYSRGSNLITETSKKEIVLTFDDGYLDNWVFAYPILKKFGLKGTIFINPEFIDPGTNVRLNLDDCRANKADINKLEFLGFMNWPEIKEVDDSGILDVQSHSMSHNFYFKSSKIIDYYSGQKEYDWLAWYYEPDQKPFYITENQKELVPYGTPIFEFGRALGLRRYFPSESTVEYAIDYYSRSGKKIEGRGDFKPQYLDACNQFVNNSDNKGRFESDFELEKRYRYELFEGKRILEENLKKKVEFLCWPGGGYNELSVKLSIEAGYKASTLSSLESKNSIDNTGYYKRIVRNGLSANIQTRKKLHPLPYNLALVHSFKAKRNIIYKLLLKAISLVYKVWDFKLN